MATVQVVWAWVVSHPWLSGVAAFVTLVLVIVSRRFLARLLKPVAWLAWRWLTTAAWVGVTVVGFVYGSSVDGAIPWVRYTFIGLSSLFAIKDGLAASSAVEKWHQTEISDMLSELSVALSSGEVRIRANLMILRDGYLEVCAASYFKFSHTRWELGQGVCGVAAERLEPMAESLDRIADAKAYEDIVDAEGGTPWRMNRSQFEASSRIRSVLSIPLTTESGRLMAVLNLDSNVGLPDSGFGEVAKNATIDAYIPQLQRHLPKTGWL